MKLLSSLFAGLLFGIGLIVSGMINPAKVQNFLDLAGTWDPSLAFVMGGAILVGAIGFRIAGSRSQPLFADSFHWPTRTDLTPALILGSGLFGVGWGLSGYCPGPAIAGLGSGLSGVLTFVIAMLVGMVGGRMLFARNLPRNRSDSPVNL